MPRCRSKLTASSEACSGLQVQQVVRSLAAAPAALLSPILQQLTGGEPEAQAVFQEFLCCTANPRRA